MNTLATQTLIAAMMTGALLFSLHCGWPGAAFFFGLLLFGVIASI